MSWYICLEKSSTWWAVQRKKLRNKTLLEIFLYFRRLENLCSNSFSISFLNGFWFLQDQENAIKHAISSCNYIQGLFFSHWLDWKVRYKDKTYCCFLIIRPETLQSKYQIDVLSKHTTTKHRIRLQLFDAGIIRLCLSKYSLNFTEIHHCSRRWRKKNFRYNSRCWFF